MASTQIGALRPPVPTCRPDPQRRASEPRVEPRALTQMPPIAEVGARTHGGWTDDRIGRPVNDLCDTGTVDDGLPLARLTKDEQWAVCARTSCGERFARRIEIPESLWSKEVDAVGEPAESPRKATLDFVAGWVRDGDEWRMSKRARKRLSQGRQPALRRPPYCETQGYESPGFIRAKYEWDDVRNRRGWRDRSDRPDNFTTNDHGLPAFVVCPACGLRQVADPVEAVPSCM